MNDKTYKKNEEQNETKMDTWNDDSNKNENYIDAIGSILFVWLNVLLVGWFPMALLAVSIPFLLQ